MAVDLHTVFFKFFGSLENEVKFFAVNKFFTDFFEASKQEQYFIEREAFVFYNP